MSTNGEPLAPSRVHLIPVHAGVTSTAAEVLTVVPAPPTGKRIVLLAYAGAVAGDVELDWRSDDTSLAGPMPLARGHFAANGGTTGLAACDTAKPLKLSISAAVRVSLFITYTIE